MGLFSSKKKVYVSSVTYPLGEDGEGKIEYLKSTVLNATLQGRSIGDAIGNAYLGGQGMSLRNAFRYARDTYTLGIPQGEGRFLAAPATEPVLAVLAEKHPATTSFQLLNTVVGTADFLWFGEAWLAQTYLYDRVLGIFHSPPPGIDADAAVSMDLEDDGLIRVLLTNANGTSHLLSVRPNDPKLERMQDYTHCAYRRIQEFSPETSVVTRPTEATDVAGTVTAQTSEDKTGHTYLTDISTITSIADGQTTITTTTKLTVTYRVQFLLYRLGSGTYPVLDALAAGDGLDVPYYPAIPMRVNNESVVDEAHQDTAQYKTSKKLLGKVGINLDDLGESLEDNESIKDIDYAYVVFGVALKVKSQEGKRYLYRYFKYLENISQYGTADWDEWVTSPLGGVGVQKQDASEPVGNQGIVSPKTNTVEIKSKEATKDNHHIKLQWQYITATQKEGVILPNARAGDVDVSIGGVRAEFSLGVHLVVDNSKLYVRKQLDENTYEELEIAGLVYENFIYKSKAVTITAYDAMTLEEEEGFIIPLNYQIVMDTPIVELTDLSYHCMHIVLNCYKVVKQKWYQRGWFRVLLFIIAIVITVVSMGTAAPAAGTLMGTIYGTLATLGVTGLLLTVLSATVYVLALAVLSAILTKVSVKAFGEKWGSVIAAIASVVMMDWAATGTFLGGFNTATSLTAQQLMMGSGALLDAYGGYAAGSMSEVFADMAELGEFYKSEMDKLEDLTKELLGTNAHLIDIQGLTEATAITLESPQTFLDRTLLLGSDVCEITGSLVTDFAELGLYLPTTG